MRDHCVASRRVMGALNYLSDIQCRKCSLNLFGAQDPAGIKLLFCTECRSGGRHEEIAEHGRKLTAEFVSRQFVENFLRKIRGASE
jgi:hypothetical protein